MISVSEAKKIISENVTVLLPVPLSLHQTAGLTLAEDIYATVDIPPFPQSSMDGYAFSFEGWKQSGKLKIVGEVAAGSSEQFILQPENAVRIFTGAPVPKGADTVIMQEKVKTTREELIIEDENLQAGNSIRPKGSEVKAGTLALEKGTILSPAAIGFLSGIGITEVKVYPDPSVSIIITGNEFQQQGMPLRFGQVYESNSFALKAVLEQLRVDDVRILYAVDSPEIVAMSLQEALRQSDIILLTGGIS